jgi:outer membrane protein assembly factor BamB
MGSLPSRIRRALAHRGRTGAAARRAAGRARVARVAVAAAGATLTAGVVAGCGAGSGVDAASRPSGPTAPIVAPAPVSPTVEPSAAALDWTTYGRTSSRDGLSVSTPAPGEVRRSWTARLDGAVYGQPLVFDGEVLVATENDSVYALSETTGRVVWRRHLASPVTGGLPCGNINPSGITGTPAIDAATRQLYVVTFTATPTYHHTLWDLDTTTGAVVSSRPVDVPGSDPRSQQQRSALAILGTRVYVAYGGLDGDCSDYKGRVVGVPLAGSGPEVDFTTDNEREAGIWEPPGPSVANGSLYVATGNGSPADRIDDSDSVLRLSPDLQPIGIFTPVNYEQLSAGDGDLGTTGPAQLPHHLVFMVGKQGIAYVLDGLHLGGTGGALANAPLCSGAFGGDAVDGDVVVVSCYSGLYTATVRAGGSGGPVILRGWAATGIAPGPPIIAGGVVWDVTRGNTLVGFRLGDGRRVFETGTAPVVTSFPSLSASGRRLFVPEGSQVVSYLGV